MPTRVQIFLDERVEQRSDGERWIVASVCCGPAHWTNAWPAAARIGELRPRRRLAAISRLLEELQGFALLTYADLPTYVVPAGLTDKTTDIPRMKRRDLAWSVCILTNLGASLALLRGAGLTVAEIEVYHDPKSLTAEHRRSIEQSVQGVLPEIAKLNPVSEQVDAGVFIQIPVFRSIPKLGSDETAKLYEAGVAIAHHLCSQGASVIGEGRVHRVELRNHTETVKEIISNVVTGRSQAT